MIDVDDELTHDHPVGEGDEAGVTFELGVGDEPAGEAIVDRADVGDRVPDLGRWAADDDLFSNRCHDKTLEPPLAGGSRGLSVLTLPQGQGEHSPS